MNSASVTLAASAALLVSWAAAAAPAQASTQLKKVRHAVETARSDEGSLASLGKHLVEVEPGVYLAVRGKRERRQVRHARWVEMLEGDRKSVFNKLGAPTHRFYETTAGIRTETWIYPRHHVKFVFRGDEVWRKHRY